MIQNRNKRRKAGKEKPKYVGSKQTFANLLTRPDSQFKALNEAKNRLSLAQMVELTLPLSSKETFSNLLWGKQIHEDYRPVENVSATPNDILVELRWYAAELTRVNEANI